MVNQNESSVIINNDISEQQNLQVSHNRPQISGTIDRFNKHLSNSEISYINKIYHKDNKKKGRTIFDMKLGEIMENTTNFFNDFLMEYSNKIYDTELYYSDNSNNYGFFENLKIYIIAFVRYINENDNIIYFGIILILISLILYFLNITRGNKNE